MLYLGDCLDILPTLETNSVDSVVTDPPYGLGFMGKAWDHGVPSPLIWKEVLRVLKPGGHLLAFGGSRTYHRIAVAIEDSGFEIRDTIMWIYGTGFPKSLNGPWGGTALKPAHEPITVARKPLIGTVAANVLAHGTGGLNIDECRIATNEKLGGGDQNATTKIKAEGWDRPWMRDEISKSAHAERINANVAKAESLGRFPANVIHDGSDEVVAAFPITKSNSTGKGKDRGIGFGGGSSGSFLGHRPTEVGSAARFFYGAKASKADRGEGNDHPTVKPTALMRYLCRLVTPAGGTVLDPFAGSGSTGKAAILEGFGFVGIEKEPAYVAIAERRIAEARTLAVAAE